MATNRYSNRKMRKQTSSKQSIKQALKNFSELKILTESSHHFSLQSLATMSYSDSGIFTDGWTCTNRMLQGTANNQHIGNSISLKLIHYTLNVFAPVNSPDTARVLVILDHGPKGSPPLLTNLFDDPNQGLSCLAPNSMQQYSILADHYIDVGGYLPVRTLSFTVRLKSSVKYFGSNNDLASIENNAVYIMVISVNGQNSTEVLNFWSSLHYYDL